MKDPEPALDARRKQLLYRANHRGIKEMDILLGGFAAERIDALGEDELSRFEALLEETDQDLLNWFTGVEPAPERIRSSLFAAILQRQKARIGEL